MIKLTLLLALALPVLAQDEVAKPSADGPPILKVGALAPDFNLPGVDGKMHSLSEYNAAKVLVLVFTCNHCPVAQMYEKRLKQMVEDYRGRGVALVAINPTDPTAVRYSEMGHTDVNDMLEVALQYGPTATPHAFIFDQGRILRYQGRLDSSQREELVTKREARAAIDALLAGKPVAVTDTPAVGCSTKWAYKNVAAKAEAKAPEKAAVSVDLVSVEQVKALRKSTGGKFVVLNFWATWCAPCVAEFPELQRLLQMYRKRPFDVVTVSIHVPDEKELVLNFLREQHAITKNLLFNFNDPAEGVAAFGSDWSGGVPFTVLLSPAGEILYRVSGAINPLELRRAILKALPDDHYIGT